MWPSLEKTQHLLYRSSSRKRKNMEVSHHAIPFFAVDFQIFLDLHGDDHYQKSERNPHRKIRRQNGQWQFLGSDGVYHPFRADDNQSIEDEYKRLRLDRNAGSRSNMDTPLSKFLTLMNAIRRNHSQFAIIYTDQKGSVEFKATYGPHPGRRQRRLRQRVSGTWQFIPNVSNDGTMLLIPPKRYDSTDISDFARTYDESAWRELFEQIEQHSRRNNYWVYTHGGGEDVLHIRFEPFDKRKYY